MLTVQSCYLARGGLGTLINSPIKIINQERGIFPQKKIRILLAKDMEHYARHHYSIYVLITPKFISPYPRLQP